MARIAGVVVLLAILGGAAFAWTVVLGRRRFRALVIKDVTRLFSDKAPSVGPEQLAARWDALPEPVRRYLSYAIPKGTPAIGAVRLKHDGFFRTKPDQRWFPIQGEQYFTAGKPGFVWNATIRPARLVWIEARDRLQADRGNMLVKFCSTFTIADASGAEIDQGSKLRWLGEAVWFPYGLVGDQIQWEAIDERSAKATLLGDGPPVSATFEVDQEGKIVCLRATRYRDIGGGNAVLTPWIGRYAGYRDFNGLRVPSSIEAVWSFQDGEFSYARFRVTNLEYNVPERF
jgi:hypothetical protein